MEEFSVNYQNDDLDELIIKDNEYRRKLRLKYFAIIFPIILIIVIVAIVIIILSLYRGGKLSCIYITKNDNESVILLNEKIYQKYKIKIKIDNKSIDKTNIYTFPKAGNHLVIFEFKEKVSSLENFFEGIDKLYDVDISQLIFEEDKITTLSKLFYNCINLKKINININIKSKIESTSEMFYNCQSLENIDFLKNLDTSNVSNMSKMFAECTSLNIDNISLRTNKVKDMSRMFYHCKNLTSIKKLDIDTSEVTDFSGMFELCENLENINISNLKTSKAISFSNFFSGCISLTSINLSEFDTSNVIDMSSFFADCRNLISLDLSKFNTNKVLDLSGMFSNCEKLISLDLSNFNTENVVEMEELFLGCINLIDININNFNFNKVEDMSYMFANCIRLKEIKLGNISNISTTFEKLKSIRGICYGCSNLEKFDFNIDNNNTQVFNIINDMSLSFAYCISLLEIKISNINSNNNIAMNEMFLNCESLIQYDFSPFFSNKEKNIKISNMRKVFKNCINLTSVDFSNLNFLNLYDFSEAFYGCKSLISLDLSKYSFTNIYYMDRSFFGCNNLELINLPKKMNNLINAKNLFQECSKLNIINLTNFSTSPRLMNISGMFKNCTSLVNLSFSLMDTYYLINMDEMFYGCINLSLAEFNIFRTNRLKSINKLFYDCKSLNEILIKTFEIREPININDIFKGVSNKSVIIDYFPDNLFNGLNKEIDRIKKE